MDSKKIKQTGVLFLVLLALNVYGQDEIITKEGEKLSVRIVLEEKKSVSYYLMDDPAKSIQTIDKKMIDKIRFEKPSQTANTIVVTDESRSGRDLFSHLVSYLIDAGYEIDVFDMEHSRVGAFSGDGFRISAEVESNKALFSCYVREKTVSSSTSQTKGHIIRFREPDRNEEKRAEIYPGEKRMSAETKEFKALDEICRTYLMKNRGDLEYLTEKSS